MASVLFFDTVSVMMVESPFFGPEFVGGNGVGMVSSSLVAQYLFFLFGYFTLVSDVTVSGHRLIQSRAKPAILKT